MAWCLLFHCRDGDEAEATTIVEGLWFANRWPIMTKVVVETDCSNRVSKVFAGIIDRSATSPLVMDIKEAMDRRFECSILKIGRDPNKIAHNLIHNALKTNSSKASFSLVPPRIQDLVYNDRSRCWGVSRYNVINGDFSLAKNIVSELGGLGFKPWLCIFHCVIILVYRSTYGGAHVA
jgi:hypothetical protein